MAQRQSDLQLTDRQEKALLKAAAAAVRAGFADSEHPACPKAATIRDLARRRVPLAETSPLVDHIATCSPCFIAYSRYRSRYRAARLTGPTIAVIVCLLALALGWWNRTTNISTSQSTPAHVSTGPVLSAKLDYRTASPLRSAGPTEQPGAPHLQKGLLDLIVLLPFGTEDGNYSIEVRTGSDQVLVRATGTARWNGNAEELTSRIDLRQLGVGNYKFALRRAGASWHIYALILEERK